MERWRGSFSKQLVMTTFGEIGLQLDATCSADANLQHLLHMFEGYRDRIKGDTDCPYTPGSAREYSWARGQEIASKDVENYHTSWINR